MKKTILIISILGVFLLSGYYLLDQYLTNSPSDVNITDSSDAFSVSYNIDNKLFVPTSADEVYLKMGQGDSFILFVGRETCPYCQQVVPELHESVLDSDYDSILYIDSQNEANRQFMLEQDFEGVPVTIFIESGQVVSFIPGYVDKAYFDSVINTIKESTT